MKIIKKSAFENEKAALVFNVFDKAIASYGVLPFDLEFHIGSQSSIDANKSKIAISYYDDFIQESDAKGIFARVMYSLHMLLAKKAFPDEPEIIQQIIAGRSMAVLCREQLFYMMFLGIAKTKSIESFEQYLSAIVPYAVFSTVDAYSAELLCALVRKKAKSLEYEKQAKKFLSVVCKPIDTERSLTEAVQSYEGMINENAGIEV